MEASTIKNYFNSFGPNGVVKNIDGCFELDTKQFGNVFTILPHSYFPVEKIVYLPVGDKYSIYFRLNSKELAVKTDRTHLDIIFVGN